MGGLRMGLIGIGLAVAGLTAGCSSMDTASRSVTNLLTPYRVDVIQGNFVSQEQAAALQRGMPRAQVAELLGTPLLTSVFHADRWDYVFTLKREGVPNQTRRVTAFFKGDELLRVDGAQDLPSESQFVDTLASQRKFGKPPVLEASEEALQKANPPKKAKASPSTAPDAPAPTVSYPPLEGAAR